MVAEVGGTPSGLLISSADGKYKVLGRDYDIPVAGSMTRDQALKFYGDALTELKSSVNSQANITTRQKAGLLKYWENEFKLARNNAIADQADLVAISKANPIETYWQAEYRISQELKLSGNKLYGEVIRSTDPQNQIRGIRVELQKLDTARLAAKVKDRCFAAGTLVHTKEGLRPIEQIKVGDWVLSQPEVKGELSYNRVTRTFVHEPQNQLVLLRVSYVIEDPEQYHLATEIEERGGEKVYFGKDWILATGNHPIYTKGKGWVNAYDLYWGNSEEVEILYGRASADATQVFATSNPNFVWSPLELRSDHFGGPGHLVELGEEGLKVERQTWVTGVEVGSYGDGGEMIDRAVYNFEVEDNHTYYVGRAGLWVHNKGVLGEEIKRVDGSQPGRPLIYREQVNSDSAGVKSNSALFEELMPGYRVIAGDVDSKGLLRHAAPAVEYNTPWRTAQSEAANYKVYDSVAPMPNGAPSTLRVDGKYRNSSYADAFVPRADRTAQHIANAEKDLAFELAKVSENIRPAATNHHRGG